jgi:uncharacterized protein (TIGR02391 family)
MASRKPIQTEPRPANLTVAQMQQATPRLERRLGELESFASSGAGDNAGDQAKALQQKYDDLLIEVFGSDTIEYKRYRVLSFYESSGPLYIGRKISPAETAENYRRGVAKGAANLRTILELFAEKLGDAGSGNSGGSALLGLQSLNLHPEIDDAVTDLFKGGHYANAVEDACKALDLLVKLRSKRTDPSGTELMQLVFSPKSPVLRFNEQHNDSERSEQQGMMYLYAGTMLAFRNPRAHGLMEDDPEVALEIIGFVNFLAKALSRTRRS